MMTTTNTKPALGTMSEIFTCRRTGRPARHVSLACSGNWQPVFARCQYADNSGEFIAYECRFVAITRTLHDGKLIGEVTHTGSWVTRAEAERFARSWGCQESEVREVEPYWYVPHFGPASSWNG